MTIKAVSRLNEQAASDVDAVKFVQAAAKQSGFDHWLTKITLKKADADQQSIVLIGKTLGGGINLDITLDTTARKPAIYLVWMVPDGLQQDNYADGHSLYLPEGIGRSDWKSFQSSYAKMIDEDSKFMKVREDVQAAQAAFFRFYELLVKHGD